MMAKFHPEGYLPPKRSLKTVAKTTPRGSLRGAGTRRGGNGQSSPGASVGQTKLQKKGVAVLLVVPAAMVGQTRYQRLAKNESPTTSAT